MEAFKEAAATFEEDLANFKEIPNPVTIGLALEELDLQKKGKENIF